jgi:capsular exopolysaccharide synthesis family protein
LSTTEEALKKAMEKKADEARVRGDVLQNQVEEVVRSALEGGQKAHEEAPPLPNSSEPPELSPERKVLLEDILPTGQSLFWHRGINSIAVNLKLKAGEAKRGAILFASSVSAEGTTTICSNVARALAKIIPGNVLLVDCNLQRPEIHNVFKTEANPGLIDILSGEIKWEEAVRKSNLKNFFVLPLGQTIPEPLSLLGSEKMEGLLMGFKAAFEFIILDLPPILGSPLAEMIVPWVEASVLVIKAHATRREVVVKAVERIIGHKDFLGAVYNQQQFVIPKFFYKRLL